MKKLILTSGLLLALSLTARATLFSYDYNTANTVIPDGSLVGIADSRTVDLGVLTGTTTSEIVNVNVRLNISGGYNGDLYGYLLLRSDDGSTTTSILLNRVGRTGAADFGYSTSGFEITLSGDTGVDIHGVSTPAVNGTYLADGRAINPNGDFTDATRTAGLEVLNTHNANGTWTLFLADVAGGDQSTLMSWGLDITVVPEPATWALLIFGIGLGVVAVGRQWQRVAM